MLRVFTSVKGLKGFKFLMFKQGFYNTVLTHYTISTILQKSNIRDSDAWIAVLAKNIAW